MALPLEGKTALVTGATRGIGKVIALQLAADGANVAICGRSEQPGSLPGTLGETEAAIAATGRDVLSVRADVTNDDEVQALIDRTYERFGKLDILVNNAGGAGGRQPFIGGDAGVLDFNYRLNMRAPWVISQMVAPKMAAAGGGAIINLTSGAARNAQPPTAGAAPQLGGFYVPAYGTTKAALDRWATAVAAELMAENIAIINVNPGFTITERVTANPQGNFDLSRAERPETTAKVISFLCLDPLKYTGQILTSRAFFDEHKLE